MVNLNWENKLCSVIGVLLFLTIIVCIRCFLLSLLTRDAMQPYFLLFLSFRVKNSTPFCLMMMMMLSVQLCSPLGDSIGQVSPHLLILHCFFELFYLLVGVLFDSDHSAWLLQFYDYLWTTSKFSQLWGQNWITQEWNSIFIPSCFPLCASLLWPVNQSILGLSALFQKSTRSTVRSKRTWKVTGIDNCHTCDLLVRQLGRWVVY